MPEYSVFFSARARRDLNAAQRWLTQPGSGLKARLKVVRIGRALTELQFRPDRWSVGDHPGVRQRVVQGHVIVYRIDETAMQVRIIRVFGPFQDRSAL